MDPKRYPCQAACRWLMQQLSGDSGQSAPPLGASLSDPVRMTMPPAPAIAIAHALIAILGALSIAVAYYSNSVIKRPSQEARYRRNAGLIFLRSVIPAPVAGWLCVASVNRLAPYTTGDYRYEWAVTFAAGTVAMAIIKKLSAGLMAQELLPTKLLGHPSTSSAPTSGEENP